MDDNQNCETFIFLSSNKLVISIYSELNKRIYKNEISFEEDIDVLKALEKLDYFLDKEIFKIEKKIKNFVKKVNIILDLNVFFSVEISIKDINYDDNINKKNLNYLLYEAKDYCKKTIGDRKISHMIINSYHIDNRNYSFFPKDISGKNFSLDLNFICISKNLIKSFEKVLKKYQISIGKIVDKRYISKFLNEDENDIFQLTKKILAGYNPNEIIIANKTHKNQGFFEKFFNFFN